MANISQIELHGAVYEVKDTTARTDSSIQSDWNVNDSESKAYIKNKPTLGTASALDVSESGNASITQVVRGNDTRLTDSRNAADVPDWAKEPNKPSYTASDVGAIAVTDKGVANGVAELDAIGKVPSSQLPSYVDEVLEYDTKASFPATGETGKIYVDKTTNLTWRWGGSEYVEISPSIALGETSSTAYAGDKGKANADAINGIQKLIPSSATESNKLVTAADIPIVPSISGKADKVSSATNGNFAGLDTTGNLTDSGKKASDFATSTQGGKADTAVQTIQINGAAQTKTNGVVNLPAYPTTLPASDTTDTYSNLGTAPVSGKAVAAALGTLNVSSEGGSGKYIQSISETDGKISATAADMPASLPASDVYDWAKEPSKPSYTASEVGAIATTAKGAANGVAELDSTGKVPSSQLPSLVDTAYTHATDSNRLTTAKPEGLYKIATTVEGHVKSVTVVAKSDITGLGIPAQDTTYSIATDTTDGLMSADNKKKLDGIEAGAEANVQSDWNETNDASDAYIKNKPTTMPASDVYDWAKASTKPSYTASEVGAAQAVHNHSMSDITDLPSPIGTAATKDSTQYVTENSTDLVESGAVYSSLELKQDLLEITKPFDLHYTIPVGYIFMWNGSDDNGYNLESGHWYKKTSTSVQGDTFEEVKPITLDETPTENSINAVTSGGVYNAIQNVTNGSKIICLKQGSLDYLTIPANQKFVSFNYSSSGLHDTDYTIIQRFDKENNTIDFGNLMITPTLPFADPGTTYHCNYLISLNGTTKKEAVDIDRTGNVGMLSVDTASTSDITFRVFGIKL